MSTITYYTISVDVDHLSESMRGLLAYQIYNDEVHISPNLKLSGIWSAAHIDNLATATSYLEVCQTVLEKRYGCNVVLRLQDCSESSSTEAIKKIESDSTLIRARIEQRCFAPNRKPHIPDATNLT